MKKLSSITENVWDDIRRQSTGELVKKEDELTNIKDIKPIDVGLSVLWADRDLEYEDDCYFTFDEAFELIKDSEWRIPTLEEVAELDRLKSSFSSNDKEFYFEFNGQHLGFPKTGFKRQIYSPMGFRGFMVDEDRFYYGWTSTPYDKGSSQILTFDRENIWHSPINNKRITSQVIQLNHDKLCVRLVKDKK